MKHHHTFIKTLKGFFTWPIQEFFMTPLQAILGWIVWIIAIITLPLSVPIMTWFWNYEERKYKGG